MTISGILKYTALLLIALTLVQPASAACHPPARIEASAAKALTVICTLAQLDSFSPDALRKSLQARVTPWGANWAKAPPSWSLDYYLSGDFGPLKPEGVDFQWDGTEDSPPNASLRLRFTINSKQTCVSADQLNGAFQGKLTEPLVPEMPYHNCMQNGCGGRSAPTHFILDRSPGPKITFGYFTGNCLEEVFVSQQHVTPPNDAERDQFVFIPRTMKLDAAKRVLAERGFTCGADGGFIAGSKSETEFECKVTLSPNDDKLLSQTVMLSHRKASQEITAVLIHSWLQP